jgi:hypothetical protein
MAETISFSVRLTKDESDAMDRAAARIGWTKTRLIKIAAMALANRMNGADLPALAETIVKTVADSGIGSAE